MCSFNYQDQTGLMPNRHIYFNLRSFFVRKTLKLVTLDAQRAFDQIEWKYMMAI